MAEIVNLRQARKRAARAHAESAAAKNRRLHGVPKAERALAARLSKSEADRLDGARLTRTGAPRDDDVAERPAVDAGDI